MQTPTKEQDETKKLELASFSSPVPRLPVQYPIVIDEQELHCSSWQTMRLVNMLLLLDGLPSLPSVL